MKRLSIFLLLAAIIISCQNTGSDSSEPNLVQIGTWSVNMDQLVGTYTGKQSKSKAMATMQAEGDTTYFESPDGHNIQIYDVETGEPSSTRFGFRYIDSTYSAQFFEESDVAVSGEIYTPFTGVDPYPSTAWGVGNGVSLWLAQFNAPFDCDSTYQFEDEYIKVHMLKDDSSFYQAFHFDASGILDAARLVVCEDSLGQAP